MHAMRPVHYIVAVLTSLCCVSGALAADVYVTDPSHTQVGFTVRHFVITKVRGKFKDFVGTITYDESDVTKSSVQGTIKTASIDTDHQKRDDHLRSPDFFDVAHYPEITFVSKRVEKRQDSLMLIGDLTIRAVTKEVAIPFTITGKVVDPSGKTRLGFEGNLRINRQEYGVSYNKTMDNGGLIVSDTVDIELIGEAVKQG
jgi:polyisoprenoid-binding protein YceI